MTRARLALVCIALAAGCGRSGVPEPASGASRWPRPQPRDVADPLVWHSWDVQILSVGSAEQAVLNDVTGSVKAAVELYESGSDFSVVPGTPFGDYDAVHPDNASQQSETVRYQGSIYPYAGKSLTPRVSGDEPAPSGVYDLQLHPPNDDRFVVAAFVTPSAGRYVVTDFGAHRFLSDAGASYVAILLGSDPDVPGGIESEILFPSDDGVWQTQDGPIDLGMLSQNERICFAVYRGLIDMNAFGDATEVSFTITRSEN